MRESLGTDDDVDGGGWRKFFILLFNGIKTGLLQNKVTGVFL